MDSEYNENEGILCGEDGHWGYADGDEARCHIGNTALTLY